MKKNSEGFTFILPLLVLALLTAGIIFTLPNNFEECRKFPGSSYTKMYQSTCTTIYGVDFKQEVSNHSYSDNETETQNWETYTNSKYSYSFMYPPIFEIQRHGQSEGYEDIVSLEDTENDQNLYINFSVSESEVDKRLYLSYKNDYLEALKNNDPLLKVNPDSSLIAAESIELSEATVSGHKTYQKEIKSKTDILTVSMLEKNNWIVTIQLVAKDDIEKSKDLCNQILSTFKFIDSNEEQFCGGIMGRECPTGYACKLDGNYPDAGGVCIKN